MVAASIGIKTNPGITCIYTQQCRSGTDAVAHVWSSPSAELLLQQMVREWVIQQHLPAQGVGKEATGSYPGKGLPKAVRRYGHRCRSHQANEWDRELTVEQPAGPRAARGYHRAAHS